MQNLVLSPIDPEILITRISERVTANILNAVKSSQTHSEQSEELFNVQDAAQFLNLTVPTIYSKVSRGELPVMKRAKRLYFSRNDLLDYLKEGRRKTNAEIEAEANNYLSNKKRLK